MKFYFDMDGVLVNFNSMVPNNSDLNHPSEQLTPEKRAAKTQFWRKIEQTPNFWRDIPMTNNADYMLSVAHECGEIFVLSKPPSAKHFATGQDYVNFVANEKRKWIATNFPYFFNESHVIICDSSKGKLIKPTFDDILVDDRQENVKDWVECGGRGILFRDAMDTVNKIQMEYYISRSK